MATAAPPVIQLTGVVKDYKGLRPLRVALLTVADGERVAVAGFDATAAEVLVNLVNGAILPDAGSVSVLGRDTADIGDETEWLASLERFGIVTPRAVLLEGATLLQNLALPMTLEIDRVPDDIQARIRELARRVGIAEASLGQLAGEAPADVRMRVHLARAVALRPQVLLFEHPTLGVSPEVVTGFAHNTLRVVSEDALTVLAVTNDPVFTDLVAQRAYTLRPATGELVSNKGWRRWLGM
mgnify:FL=1